jgi:uncharacterized membrane protein YbhN (UPF0104 family)
MSFPTAFIGRSNLFRILGALIATALIAAVAYFFYRELAANWSQFLEYDWDVRYELVAISLVVLFVVFAISPLAWVKILKLQGAYLAPLPAFLIFYLANLGKYIPGKLWGYGGQVYLTKRQGVDVGHIIISTGVLLVLDYFAGLAFASLTVVFWPSVPAAAGSAGAVGITVLVALFSRSERSLGLMKRGLARVKVTAFETVQPGRELFGIWLFLLSRWFLLGVAFIIGIKALLSLSLTESIAYCGAFTLSHLLSMLVVIMPAGLGVREGLNVYLLSAVATMPPYVAIGISVATRLWMTIMELICVVPAVGVKRILK